MVARRRLITTTAAAALLAGAVAGPAAAAPSCAAQFVTAVTDVARPLGLNIVRPEIRTLDLGGRNLGDEVSFLLATADRTACPVTP